MSDKGAKAEQKPSIWPLVAMMMLTVWMCSRPADPKQGFEQCGAHLHKIGVDLEKFRLTSEDGLYPVNLEDAFAKNPLPTCPTGGKKSYIEGYQAKGDRRSYVLVCKGDHHAKAGVPSDYPRIAFNSAEGAPHSEAGVATPTPNVSSTPEASPSPQLSATPKISASPKATTSPQVVPTTQKSPQQKPQIPGQSPSPQSSPAHP